MRKMQMLMSVSVHFLQVELMEKSDSEKTSQCNVSTKVRGKIGKENERIKLGAVRDSFELNDEQV